MPNKINTLKFGVTVSRVVPHRHRKEGRLEAKGEKLLQDLVSQEAALMSKLDDAKAEAAKLIADAEGEAQGLIAKAKKSAESKAKKALDKAQAETEKVRESVLSEANAAVTATQANAKSNLDKAVNLVMERVLP